MKSQNDLQSKKEYKLDLEKVLKENIEKEDSIFQD